MTALMLDQTRQQNELLAQFTACLEKTQQNITELARLYKACAEAGIDMSCYGSSLGLRLLKIAEGCLVPKATAKILALPDATVKALASLTKSEQQRLWDDGVEIWRDERAQKTSVEMLRAGEARRLVDIVDGRGRLLSPLEQKERATPVALKRDQIVSVRLTYEERVDALAWAHKKGKPLDTLIRELLRNAVS